MSRNPWGHSATHGGKKAAQDHVRQRLSVCSQDKGLAHEGSIKGRTTERQTRYPETAPGQEIALVT